MAALSTKRVWALFICMSMLFVAASGCLDDGDDDKPKNDPPEAVINSPDINTEIEKGGEITLDGLASSDPNDDELEYYWVSDKEGDLSSLAYDKVYLNEVGTHVITLTVVDEHGLESDPESVPVKVLPPNEPPIAKIDSPVDGKTYTEDEAVNFDGSRSVDPEGKTLTYSWSINTVFESSEKEFDKVFSTSKDAYEVVLKVTDDKGLFATDDVKFYVKNQPPKAKINTSATDTEAYVGETLNFSAKGSSDPEGGALTYHWDFGDNNGTSEDMITSYAYQQDGRFKVTLLVTDDESNEDTDDIFVNILSRGPVAHFTMNASARVGEQIDLNASTTEAPASANITLYEWDFGDGNTNETNQTTVNHTWDTAGNHTVTLTVTDSNDNSNTTTMVVRIVPLNYTANHNGGTTFTTVTQTEEEWEETFEINWFLTNGTVEFTITNNQGNIDWWLEFRYPDDTVIFEDSDTAFNGEYSDAWDFDMSLIDEAEVGPDKYFEVWFRAEHTGIGASTPQYEFDIFTFYD